MKFSPRLYKRFDYMLKDLEILNGKLSPQYDVYNNIYTISIDEDIYSLVLNYELEENAKINIIGNEDFQVGENVVYLEVYNENDKETITLYVNKKEEQKASVIDPNIIEKVEVTPDMPKYIAPLIGGSCFLIILITFCLLFAKRRIKK